MSSTLKIILISVIGMLITSSIAAAINTNNDPFAIWYVLLGVNGGVITLIFTIIFGVDENDL